MRVETLRAGATMVRGRRGDLGLSQAALAARAGVSRKWINEYENGKATVEFGLLLRVWDALDLVCEVRGREEIPPEAPEELDLDALLRAYTAR